MELTLTPELESLIARKLATGRYATAEQILVEALKSAVEIDEQREATLAALRHMIDDGSAESASARDFLRAQKETLPTGATS